MSNTVNSLVVVVPSVTASIIAYTTNASPLEYGIVGVVLTVGLIPVVKWMMRRMDIAQQADINSAKHRDDNMLKQIEVLTEIRSELRTLNTNHSLFANAMTEQIGDLKQNLAILLERKAS